MSFNINDIRSQLTFGGARSAQFQVQITNPVDGLADLKTPFMVKASQIPPSTLGVTEVSYMGRKIRQAGDRTFEEWAVTVINDEDFLIRNAMEKWSSAINSHEGNVRGTGGSSPALYKSQAQIMQFSKTGDIIRTYDFHGLWPSLISSIEVAWESENQIQEFTITFQYDWWSVHGVTGNGGTKG